MTLFDNPLHRRAALQQLHNIHLLLTDIQTEISIAVAAQPPLAILQLLVEADVHISQAADELAAAAARIQAI